jgi:hypothetical protein
MFRLWWSYEDLEVLDEDRQVRCPGLGGSGAAVNEQQRFALAVDFVIDPKSVGLDVRSCRCHLRQLSSLDRCSLCGMLVVGYSLRDDLGDVLGGVEVGNEPVLGQCECGPGLGVDVGGPLRTPLRAHLGAPTDRWIRPPKVEGAPSARPASDTAPRGRTPRTGL